MLIFVLGMLCGALLLAASLILRKRLLARAGTDLNAETAGMQTGQELLTDLNAQLANLQQEVSDYRTVMENYRRRLHELQSQEKGKVSSATLVLLEELLEDHSTAQQRLASVDLAVLERSEELAACLREVGIDALTQIPNRRGFDAESARRLAQWERHQISFALLLVDVDSFKSLNDQYGHLAGDEVLRQVASRMQRSLRQADFICRFGGEEFAVIFPNQETGEACQAAERLRLVFEREPLTFDGHTLPVTISGGLTMVQSGDNVQTLLARADAALYAAKRSGRNLVHWHAGEEIKVLTSPSRPGKKTLPS